MAEKYTRQIKNITGSGSTAITLRPTPGKRVHNVQANLGYAGGTNTLAALVTIITNIKVKVGTVWKWNLSGTQLRDFLLLWGTTFDWNGVPNTGAQLTIPLAPEWFTAVVNDSLAWNPARLGGDISIEITCSSAVTVNKAFETVSDDLDAPSSGILTLEVITPVAGSTSFFVSREIEPRGRLISAHIYPDSGGTNEITPASLLVGGSEVFAHEGLSSAENDEALERKGLTPAASGRTANIYDMVFVKDDMLSRAIDLVAWGVAKLKVEAGSAMSGTTSILLARLEQR